MRYLQTKTNYRAGEFGGELSLSVVSTAGVSSSTGRLAGSESDQAGNFSEVYTE